MSIHNYRNGVGPNIGAQYSYAQMGNYNEVYKSIRPPIPSTTVQGHYIVPAYSAPGYDTLSRGNTSGSNYSTINMAYGSTEPIQYYSSLCQ